MFERSTLGKDALRSFWLYPRWKKGRKPSDLQPVFFIIAGGVGLIGGLVAAIFKSVSSLLQESLMGFSPNILEASIQLPWYLKLIIPTSGGVLAGLVLYLLPKEGKGHGISEIMEAVSIRGGLMNLRAALVRSLSSLMSIATGASIGREGPIVQISSTLASKVGQYLHLKRENLTILVGCGVASGLAAAYNVPIAASFFVMEIIIGNFAIEIFGPLVVSSVSATLVYRRLFGNEPVYGTPNFALVSNWELIGYVILGILSGIAASFFRGSLKFSDRRFSRIKGPIYIKSGIGGLIIGFIGLQWPHVWGNGFHAINLILDNGFSLTVLVVLFYLKIFATSVSVGSGASGGVFTPTHFVGACLGGIVGFSFHYLFPERSALPSAYALVGMGCLLAGTTHAPIMAILMIFEMSLDYEIILPLMLSCIISSTVARAFNRDSIYTESLRKKGIRLDMSMEERALRSIRVEDVQRRDVPVIAGNKHFNDVLRHFLKSRSNIVYVVEQDDTLIGTIDIHDLKEFFNEKDLYSLVIARDLAVAATFVHPEQTLIDVMDLLYSTDADQIPVVKDPVSKKFLGVITRRDIIGAYNREVLKKKILLTKFVTKRKEREGIDYFEMPAGYRIGNIAVPDDLSEKTLGEVNFRSRYRFQVLAIVRTSTDGRNERLIAEPTLKLKKGDNMIVIGTDEDFEKYRKLSSTQTQ